VRMARQRVTPGELDDLAELLKHRIIGTWVAYAVDMNQRVGLDPPDIDLEADMPVEPR